MAAWEKKLEIIRHYDQAAHIYDKQYTNEQETKIKAALSALELEKNSLVLDAGCGTGLLFPHVAKNVKHIIGVDLSTKILREAKKHAKMHDNTLLVRADVDFLPFQNEIFHMIFAVTLLQNAPIPMLTLKELKRVSQKRAEIVVTGLKKAFSQKSFLRLLTRANLKISIFKDEDNLKCYVAICTKLRAS